MVSKSVYVIVVFLIIVASVMFCFRDKVISMYYLSSFESGRYSNSEYSRVLNYRLYQPKVEDGQVLPLVLYLHPFGDNGSDNTRHITSVILNWIKKAELIQYPCFILAPQCPMGMEWVDKNPNNKPPFKHYSLGEYPETEELKMTMEVIKELIKTKSIDQSRIYVIGFSMGATGCWDILCRYPDFFAGSLIASGVSDTMQAYRLVEVPVIAYSGENDQVAPYSLNKQMVEKINLQGGRAKFVLFNDEGHDIAFKALNSEKSVKWLFEQKKDR
ncbi:MAG: prolyl oligopeptidase family serine peptidase [Marinilabiliaceae bacterium]|nr:prolyl oligopeptidase family serine peptidase [Marinilabiliaceae bacterium]